MSKTELEFPIIVYLDGVFVVDGGDAYKILGSKFSKDGKSFSRRQNLKRKAKSGWLLDCTGNFFKLEYSHKERQWLKWLGFLWNFVRCSYRIEVNSSISCGELQNLIAKAPQSVLNKGTFKDFKRYLGTLDSSTPLTKDVLCRWLDGGH